jgi:hypothetical protein
MDQKHLKFGLILASLVAALVCPPTSYAVNNASLKGPYSVLLTSGPGWTPCNIVGVITFDGAGNLTGTFQTNIAGTLGSSTATGTYSLGSNSAGSLTLNLSSGSTVTYAFAFEATAKQLALVVSNVEGQSADVIGGAAVAQGVTEPYTFTNANLKGTYGMLMTKTPLDDSDGGPAIMSGTLVFDGEGNIKSGAGTFNENASVTSFTSSGTYSVSGNGTGTIALNVSGGLVANFAFAINNAGKGFQLIELTTNAGGRNDVIGGSASR